MSCLNPLDVAELANYWLTARTKSEEEGVEEHLFACDECGARLREGIALAEGIRTLARDGALEMIATLAGGSVDCTVTAEDHLLIGRLVGNLSGTKPASHDRHPVSIRSPQRCLGAVHDLRGNRR